jgi:hypothetical protein
MFPYRWLKPPNVSLITNYHCWLSNQLFSLGID